MYSVVTVTRDGHVLARPTGALPRRLRHAARTPHDLPTHTHDLSRRSPPRAQPRSRNHTQATQPPKRTHLLPAPHIQPHAALCAHVLCHRGAPESRSRHGGGGRPIPSNLAPTTCPCAMRSATGTASASACVALDRIVTRRPFAFMPPADTWTCSKPAGYAREASTLPYSSVELAIP